MSGTLDVCATRGVLFLLFIPFGSPISIVAVRHGVPLGSYSLSTFPRPPSTLEGWRAPSTLTAVEGVVGGQIWRGGGDAWEGHGRRGAGGDHEAAAACEEQDQQGCDRKASLCWRRGMGVAA